MISEKEKQACREFMIDFNWTQAMIRAKYSVSNARQNGWATMRKPEVAAYLKKLMDKHQAKQELSAERVLNELNSLAFANVLTYYKWSDQKKKFVPKPPDELTLEQQAAVRTYTPGVGYELYAKDNSLDKLGKYFKLYSETPALVQNFVVMPTVKINGKEHIFEVGKPKKP
jgi:hypothetical protein